MYPKSGKITRYTYVIFILTGICILWFTTYHGLGITYDSTEYLSAAKSLLYEGAFKMSGGQPYINWPPLYATLLALGGVNMLLWAKLIQLVSWTGTFIYVCKLSSKYLSVKISLFYQLIIVSGTPLILINTFLWSEGLFTFILLTWFYYLLLWCKKKKYQYAVILLILGNLLCLQRSAGIFFIAGMGIILLYYKRMWLSAFVFGIISSLGTIGWTIRNSLIETETATPFRENIWVISPKESYLNFAEAVLSWFVPLKNHWLAGILLFLLMISWVWSLCRKAAPEVERYTAVLLLCYLSFMLLLRMNITGESERYLAPLYPLLFLHLCLLLQKGLTIIHQSYRKIVFGIICLWLLYPALRTAKNALQWHHSMIHLQKNASK